MERRLAAILAADVVGYSRLMGHDEEGTLARAQRLPALPGRSEIAEHRGRIVKTTGDGMLVEFASAVDAVRCALDIQRAMGRANYAVPEDRRIAFRVGIHVGDIIIDDDDIFGDGVNIAARLDSHRRARRHFHLRRFAPAECRQDPDRMGRSGRTIAQEHCRADPRLAGAAP